MNALAIRIGYYSAVAMAVAFVVFTVCFVAIPLTSPLFRWTNLADYLVYVREYNQFFQITARVAMLLFGPLFVLLLCSIHDLVVGEQRVLTRISLSFGVVFAALTSATYFVQISAVPLSIAKGQTQGLDQFLQANPYSPISAINVLGWSLFFGLSSLFIAPIFSGGRLERTIKVAFLLNGFLCILGGIAYAIDNVLLVFLTLDLGMGGAVFVAMVSLAILLRRMEKGGT